MKEQSASDRRSRQDRRAKPTPPVGRFWLLGRREGPRRGDETADGYYVDRYSPRTLALVLMIIALSISDAFLTLYLISKGAAEINPVMAHFLEYGPVAFLAAKYLLTTASVLLLLIHKNFFLFRTKVRAKVLLVFFLSIFLAVVVWEIYLIFFTL